MGDGSTGGGSRELSYLEMSVASRLAGGHCADIPCARCALRDKVTNGPGGEYCDAKGKTRDEVLALIEAYRSRPRVRHVPVRNSWSW